MRFLIIDDHPLFRAALRAILPMVDATGPEIVDCGTLGDGRALVSAERFDLVLLDLVMPSVGSLEDIFEMVALAAPVPVVVVSGVSDRQVISLIRLSGAAGFVPKTLAANRIAEALRQAIDGRPIFLAEEAGNQFTIVPETEGALTPMQGKVMLLLARGKSNKEIAAELALSANTIKVHVTKILRKLGVSTRAQAISVVRRRPLDRSLGL